MTPAEVPNFNEWAGLDRDRVAVASEERAEATLLANLFRRLHAVDGIGTFKRGSKIIKQRDAIGAMQGRVRLPSESYR